MPSPPLLPKEIIELTAEYHLARHPRTAQIIYVVIILSLIAFVALPPVLMVDGAKKQRSAVRWYGGVRANGRLQLQPVGFVCTAK
ncbi:MAG: hypothetical protein SH819_09665 [Cytophagales bacterium]|nr:hypothetical protein [Cytophagales bacterium]